MALSDTLFDAELDIVRHIVSGRYNKFVNEKAMAILEEMDVLRLTPGLDTPPFEEQPPRRTADQIIMFFVEMAS